MEEAGQEWSGSSRGVAVALSACWHGGDGLERQEKGSRAKSWVPHDGLGRLAVPIPPGTFSCTGPFLHLDLSFQHGVMLSESCCVAPAQGVDWRVGGSSVQCKDPQIICVKT